MVHQYSSAGFSICFILKAIGSSSFSIGISIGISIYYVYHSSIAFIWVWVNTYENTIFTGMNIHKSQLFWCEQKGYKVLTHCHLSFPSDTSDFEDSASIMSCHEACLLPFGFLMTVDDGDRTPYSDTYPSRIIRGEYTPWVSGKHGERTNHHSFIHKSFLDYHLYLKYHNISLYIITDHNIS